MQLGRSELLGVRTQLIQVAEPTCLLPGVPFPYWIAPLGLIHGESDFLGSQVKEGLALLAYESAESSVSIPPLLCLWFLLSSEVAHVSFLRNSPLTIC